MEIVKKVTYRPYEYVWVTSGYLGSNSGYECNYLCNENSWENIKKLYPTAHIKQNIYKEFIPPSIVPNTIKYNDPLYFYQVIENQHHKIRDVESCVEHGIGTKSEVDTKISKYKIKNHKIILFALSLNDIFTKIGCCNIFKINSSTKFSVLNNKENKISHYEFKPVSFIKNDLDKILKICSTIKIPYETPTSFYFSLKDIIDECIFQEYDDYFTFKYASDSLPISNIIKIVSHYIDITKFKYKLNEYLRTYTQNNPDIFISIEKDFQYFILKSLCLNYYNLRRDIYPKDRYIGAKDFCRSIIEDIDNEKSFFNYEWHYEDINEISNLYKEHYNATLVFKNKLTDNENFYSFSYYDENRNYIDYMDNNSNIKQSVTDYFLDILIDGRSHKLVGALYNLN